MQEVNDIGIQQRSLRNGLVADLGIRLPEGITAESSLAQQIMQDQLRRRYWLDILSQQNQESGANAMLLTFVAFLGAPFTFSPRNVCRVLQNSFH